MVYISVLSNNNCWNNNIFGEVSENNNESTPGSDVFAIIFAHYNYAVVEDIYDSMVYC